MNSSEAMDKNALARRVFDHTEIAGIIAAHSDMPGAMLPILHALQDRIGYIPPQAVPLIAEQLNVSRAEVHGVITYYHHFRQHPVGSHVVQICRAEACQASGVNALIAHAKKVLDCDFHETSEDGEFTLEPAYCLGQCACAPAMMIGDDIYGLVDMNKFDRLIAAKRGAP